MTEARSELVKSGKYSAKSFSLSRIPLPDLSSLFIVILKFVPYSLWSFERIILK